MFGKISSEQMTDGPLLKKIIVYTVPIIATGVLQLLFNAADLIVVGRYSGKIALAAVGATGSLINLIVTLFIGLSVGTSVTVAQRLGAGNADGTRRVVHTSMATSVIGGIIVMLIGWFFSRTFLEWMGTPETVIDLSTLYMKIYFLGMPASMIYNFGGAILRSSGDTKRPLIILSSAGVLNVILNLCFVILLKMSVDGVALATTVSQCLSAVLVVVCLAREKSSIRLEIKKIRLYGPELRRMLAIGIPAGLQSATFSISNVIIQSSVNSFGDVFMSGNAAGANIEGFIYVAMNAFHQTALTFSGQNIGAGKPERVDRVLGICVACVTVTGIAFGAGAFGFRNTLLGIYLPDAADAVQAGIQRMQVISTTYFTCGIMDVIQGTVRGMGSSVPPMVITLISVCGLRIVWVYTAFAAKHTPFMLYVSYPISWLVCIAAMVVFYLVYRKKVRSQITNSGL